MTNRYKSYGESRNQSHGESQNQHQDAQADHSNLQGSQVQQGGEDNTNTNVTVPILSPQDSFNNNFSHNDVWLGL